MGNLSKISVVVLTNGEILSETLASFENFGEVLFIHTGEAPYTPPLKNSALITAPYNGDLTRQIGITQAKYDWILSVDSDEVLTPELLKEINTLSLKPTTVYSIPFKNFFNKRFIRGCGWYPDRHVRLFNRKKTTFNPVRLHSSVQTEHMTIHPLKGHILHYSYRSIADFLQKMQLYSTLYAKEQNKKSSLSKAILHGLFAFFKSYILKKGFLDGAEGWIISAYQGHMAYYKYLKLRETNRC